MSSASITRVDTLQARKTIVRDETVDSLRANLAEITNLKATNLQVGTNIRLLGSIRFGTTASLDGSTVQDILHNATRVNDIENRLAAVEITLAETLRQLQVLSRGVEVYAPQDPLTGEAQKVVPPSAQF